MGRSKNTLKRSDISYTPIKTKYLASYTSASIYLYGITVNRGINAPYNKSGSLTLNYKLAQQLYYNEFITGSLLNSGSYWNDNLQSTAASGTFDNDWRYFPTASNSMICVLAIPSMEFGEQIGRSSFNIQSTDNTTYKIVDDGNGNLVDALNNNIHVGNILYAQGIAILTDANYKCILSNPDFNFTLTVL